MIVDYGVVLNNKRNKYSKYKGDTINVTKTVETKSIFMRANALKMASGFR